MRTSDRLIMIATALCLLLGACATATAADITTVRRRHCHLLLKGNIEEGDLARLKRAEYEAEEAWKRDGYKTRSDSEGQGLCLDSPGGSYLEGIKLAKHVFGNDAIRIGTVVDRDESCFSACAIIWLAGARQHENLIFPDRKLHVNGKLGFHAPHLAVRDGTYTAQSIEAAYKAGLQAIGLLARIPYGDKSPWENNVGYGYHGDIVPSGLLAEILAHGPDQMFVIDSLAKVLFFGFDLEGYSTLQPVNRNALCNACTNHNMTIMKQIHKSDGCPEGSLERTASGYSGKFPGFGGEGGYTCWVEAELENGQLKRLLIQLISTEAHRAADGKTKQSSPLWFLHLADNTLIGALATSQQVGTNTPLGKSSLWNHNGSVMRLVAEGAMRRFYYVLPRDGIRQMGAISGTLLFEGSKSGDRYIGTARIFRGACGEFTYQVEGNVSSDQRRVIMRGQAPRVDSNCRIQGYRGDELVFEIKEE